MTKPTLDAPGAGLPWWQSLFARHIFMPAAIWWQNWQGALRSFEEEAAKINKLLGGLSDQQMQTPVLVEGVIGIEDSSRFWSPSMVLEHLVMVDDHIGEILVALTSDSEPSFQVDIAAVKPANNWNSVDGLAKFNQAVQAYVRLADGLPSKTSKSYWQHPWFGPLDALGWQVLAGIHQGIHRRQLEAILRG